MNKISLSIQYVTHENVIYEKLEIPLSDFRSDGEGSIRGKITQKYLKKKKKKKRDVNTENHRYNTEKFISKIVLRISKLALCWIFPSKFNFARDSLVFQRLCYSHHFSVDPLASIGQMYERTTNF